MPKRAILVCQNSSCTSLGSAALVRDIEELAQGEIVVQEWGCLGHCGKGPNIEIQENGQRKAIKEGIKSFKKACSLVAAQDVDIPTSVEKVGKIKYEIRREPDTSQRMQLLDKAFGLIGGDTGSKSEPRLFSELLVLRSKEFLKSQVAKALKDAEMAANLLPGWAQAHLCLANALEASSRCAEGVAALERALEIGNGVNRGAVKRQMTRLERKAKEEAEREATAPPAEAASAEAAPVQGASPGSVVPVVAEEKNAPRTKSSSSSKAKSQPKPRTSSKAKPKAKSAGSEAGGVPDFLEWRVVERSRLNHNCIRLLLKSEQGAALQSQADCGPVWHIDLLKEELGEELKRAYTPVSDMKAYKEGSLEIMLKVYKDGKMTPHLSCQSVGSTVLVSAPIRTARVEDYSQGMVMIAGGSAVTVAIHLCEAVLQRFPGKPVHLAMCNHSAEDVLYADVFDKMLQKHQSFHVVHCVGAGPVPARQGGRAVWRSGRVDLSVLIMAPQHLKGVISGPRGLCQAGVNLFLKLGRTMESVNVLDELPAALDPDQAPSPREAVSKPTSPQLQVPLQQVQTPDATKGYAASAPPSFRVLDVSAKKAAVPQMSWCTLWRFCSAPKGSLIEEDGEGVPQAAKMA